MKILINMLVGYCLGLSIFAHPTVAWLLGAALVLLFVQDWMNYKKESEYQRA